MIVEINNEIILGYFGAKRSYERSFNALRETDVWEDTKSLIDELKINKNLLEMQELLLLRNIKEQLEKEYDPEEDWIDLETSPAFKKLDMSNLTDKKLTDEEICGLNFQRLVGDVL